MTPSLDRAVEAALAALRTEELNVLGGYLTPLNGARRQAMRAALLAALPDLSPGVEELRALADSWRGRLPYKSAHWDDSDAAINQCADELTAIIDNKQESSDAR